MGRERYSIADQARYTAYINSPAWARRKRRAIVRAGNRCEFLVPTEGQHIRHVRCPRMRYLCVHHLTYDRLGHEADEDLQCLCWLHHQIEHVMWRLCDRCPSRVVEHYSDAERLVKDLLVADRIDFDRGPIRWHRLPGKSLIESLLPRLCEACNPHYWEEFG